MQRFDTLKRAVIGAAAAVMIAGGVSMAIARDVAIPTPAGTFAPVGDREQSAPADPTQSDAAITPENGQGGGSPRTLVVVITQEANSGPSDPNSSHNQQQSRADNAHSTPAPVATPTASEASAPAPATATPDPHTPAPAAGSTPTPLSTPGADEAALPTPTPTPTEPPLMELMPWEPAGDPAVRKPVRMDLCKIMDCQPTPTPSPDIQYDPDLLKPVPAVTPTPGIQLDKGMTMPYGTPSTPPPGDDQDYEFR